MYASCITTNHMTAKLHRMMCQVKSVLCWGYDDMMEVVIK